MNKAEAAHRPNQLSLPPITFERRLYHPPGESIGTIVPDDAFTDVEIKGSSAVATTTGASRSSDLTTFAIVK